jgi:hypothetical protein
VAASPNGNVSSAVSEMAHAREADPVVNEDERLLHRLGYAQELSRRMSGFRTSRSRSRSSRSSQAASSLTSLPFTGAGAWARRDVVSWGLFGVLFGAIAGETGGGGFHGAVTQGVVTGIVWAVFGTFAGAPYGLWAGRSISARRLEGVGPLLGRGVQGGAFLDAATRDA